MPESIPELEPKNENLNTKKKLQKNEGASDSEVKVSPEAPKEKVVASEEKNEIKKEETKTENKKPKIKVGIVDVSSGIEDKAIDAAERELEKRSAESKGVKGFFGRVWNNNFYDYERAKAKRKAKKLFLISISI